MNAPQTPRGDVRPRVRVDVRRRVSLGGVSRVQPGDVFTVDISDDGTLTLIPVKDPLAD